VSAAVDTNWHTANQRYLVASLRQLQLELEAYRARLDPAAASRQDPAVAQELEAATRGLPAPAALDQLVATFALSSFERKLLLLCAGVELDAQISALVAALHGNAALVRPSFSLALAAFPDAHWSALSPQAPLRYWRLVDLNTEELVTRSPLRIDEHILHYLTGLAYDDERLREHVQFVQFEELTVPSQSELATAIATACARQPQSGRFPLVYLSGPAPPDKLRIATGACAQLGLHLYSLSLAALTGNTREAAEFTRLWTREAALKSCALYLEGARPDPVDKARLQTLLALIERTPGLLFVGSEDQLPELKRPQLEFSVQKPSEAEQRALWSRALGAHAEVQPGWVDDVVAHFNLAASTIEQASLEALAHWPAAAAERHNGVLPTPNPLWRACCVHTRPKIGELAQRIEPVAGWDDLILPDVQQQLLREIAAQVKHRRQVYRDWGFEEKGTRGLGISAMFTGESGTGKTMASEVLARELQLDLYRIDLSQVVNKYIGETEKNLKQIFDAAEEGGAILLFDEADALFGKRSDVRDSHDRYSNIEVSYLLQRMETYGGLALLTTNLRSAIDKAFLRRIRFVVQFPYPDAALRAAIWQRVFPAGTPLDGLDFEQLARLNIPGGNIRNIAMNAAFIAAADRQPVQMHHIARAARTEYLKLEKAMNRMEQV
jgi:hypothetical protein